MKMTTICMTYAIPCFMATAPGADVEIKEQKSAPAQQQVEYTAPLFTDEQNYAKGDLRLTSKSSAPPRLK